MAFYLQHEDAVASARPLIGHSLRPCAVLPSLLDDGFYLVLVKDFLHPEVGNEDVSTLGVAHFNVMLQVGVVL